MAQAEVKVMEDIPEPPFGVLLPCQIATRDIDIVIRVLAIVVPELRVVGETAGFLIASKPVHEVNAISRVTLNAVFGVASHEEGLVEVSEMAIPISPGPIESQLWGVWVFPAKSVSALIAEGRGK